MIKILSQLVIKKNYLNLVINIFKMPTAIIILNDVKLDVFPLRLGTMQECSLSPLLYNSILEVLANTIRHEKEIRVI